MFRTFRSISGSFSSGRRFSGRIESPTNILNNTYWFSSYNNNATEFGSQLAHNATVTTWKDNSGAAHDLNKAGSSSVKPVFRAAVQNNKGAVYFDGIDDSLNVNPIPFIQSLSQFTLFVVAKAGTLSNGAALTCSDTDGFKIFYNGTNWAVTAANGTASSTATPDTEMHIFTLVFDGTQTGNDNRLKFRVDRVSQSLTFSSNVNTTTSAAAAYFYAGQNSNGTAFFNGHMGEIVLYARALNPSELDSVEQYFINRWAIGTPSSVTTNRVLYYDPSVSASYTGSGTTLYDLSGSGVNATLGGSPADAGNWFTFTGSQSIQTGNLATLYSGWQHSLEIWFSPSAAGAVFSDTGSGPTNTGYHATGLEVYSAGPFYLTNAMLWNGAVTRVGGGSISLNNWYQLVRVYNGSNTAYAYLNTVKSANTTITWSTPSPGWYFNFGSSESTIFATGSAFQGKIGVIRLYSRVLSQAEITQNYNATKALYGL